MLNDHQIASIQALEQLKRICDNNHITMFLLAGTTLGAVRESGMIKWDDDIDVGFLYHDWIALKKILPYEISSPFEYIDYDVEEGYPRFQPKILFERRNCIDLFLISKWSKNKLSGKLNWYLREWAIFCHERKLDYKYPKHYSVSEKKSFKRRLFELVREITYFVTKPFMTPQSYLNVGKWVERFYENHQYDCYINLYSIYGMKKEIMLKEWIETSSIVTFEGKQYDTVGDTNAYLHHLYGDYMTPPPIEKRIAAHQETF